MAWATVPGTLFRSQFLNRAYAVVNEQTKHNKRMQCARVVRRSRIGYDDVRHLHIQDYFYT